MSRFALLGLSFVTGLLATPFAYAEREVTLTCGAGETLQKIQYSTETIQELKQLFDPQITSHYRDLLKGMIDRYEELKRWDEKTLNGAYTGNMSQRAQDSIYGINPEDSNPNQFQVQGLLASWFEVNQSKLLVQYPFDNPYQIATGSSKTGGVVRINSVPAIEKLIEESIRGGIDPAFTIALMWIERGPIDETQQFNFLDWRAGGPYTALGCPKRNEDGKAPRILKSDSDFAERFTNLLEGAQVPTTTDPKSVGYRNLKNTICVNDRYSVYGSQPYEEMFTFALDSEASAYRCCIKLPYRFETSSRTSHAGLRAALFHLIDREISRPVGTLDRAEDRIQKINGRAPLWIGDQWNRSAFAWRLGVNLANYPNYGWATLDYMLNSIYSNPKLAEIIETKSKQLKIRKPRSLLCHHRAPGRYRIPETYYNNLIAETPRWTPQIQMASKYSNHEIEWLENCSKNKLCKYGLEVFQGHTSFESRPFPESIQAFQEKEGTLKKVTQTRYSWERRTQKESIQSIYNVLKPELEKAPIAGIVRSMTELRNDMNAALEGGFRHSPRFASMKNSWLVGKWNSPECPNCNLEFKSADYSIETVGLYSSGVMQLNDSTPNYASIAISDHGQKIHIDTYLTLPGEYGSTCSYRVDLSTRGPDRMTLNTTPDSEGCLIKTFVRAR